MTRRRSTSNPRPTKLRPHRTAPASCDDNPTLAADEILKRAGFKEPENLCGERTRQDGSVLLAKARYMVYLSPTDCRGNDSYDKDATLIVLADPAPNVEETLVAAAEKITVIDRGPNGRRLVLIEGDRIKGWDFVQRQKYEPSSRSHEWRFRGPASEVDVVKHEMLLAAFCFPRWLREMRPGVRGRSVNQARWIALNYIAEAEDSDLLEYRGRFLSPDRKTRERQALHRRRPALAATAAACHVSIETVRRVRRDLAQFRRSAIYLVMGDFLRAGGDLTRL